MQKILVANRGEIAVRVIRACRELALSTVAVYSECDRGARHVRMADQAVAIGGNAPADSYLRIDRLIAAARDAGADAVHPGYGFLSENAAFARACRDAGLTFIGPTVEAIALMGSKTAARRAAIAAGVPVVPGTEEPFGPDVPDQAMAQAARQVGYPLLVKAVAGGGGKGMRLVESEEHLRAAVRAARSEADGAFGDSAIYLERRLVHARHIEVQVLADHAGHVVPFVERECSIQRRHQKVVEETPSPVVSSGLRSRLTAAAVAVARAAGYTSAGTVEFLLDDAGEFYFLEMNTRLQVEHGITELVTGIDLVTWQIRIARGELLTCSADAAVTPRGHALECRVYAEDADNGFVPSPGRIRSLRLPQGPWIRVDSAAESGGEVPIYYDPLVAKVMSWGADRAAAITHMQRALRESEVVGIRTTVPFFRWLLRQPLFALARFDTGTLDDLLHEGRNQDSGDRSQEDELSLEEVAAISACVITAQRRDPPSRGQQPRGWKMQGRADGLRT